MAPIPITTAERKVSRCYHFFPLSNRKAAQIGNILSAATYWVHLLDSANFIEMDFRGGGQHFVIHEEAAHLFRGF